MSDTQSDLEAQRRLKGDREIVSAWIDVLADGEHNGSRAQFVLRDTAARVLKGEHISWAEGDDV